MDKMPCPLKAIYLAFYGMHAGISDEHLRLGQRLFNADRPSIEFRDVRPWFEGIHPAHPAHGTIFHFFHLAIPDLFAGFKRIIYADSDMLFLRFPSLFYHSMGETKMLGACRDILLKLAQDPSFKLPYEIGGGIPLIDYHKGALGVQNSDDYINSGLIALNIPKYSAREKENFVISPRHFSGCWIRISQYRIFYLCPFLCIDMPCIAAKGCFSVC